LTLRGTTASGPQTRRRFVRGVVMLILAAVGSGSMLYYYLAFFTPRVLQAHAASNLAGGYEFGHDLYPVWLTAHDCIPMPCDPYSPEMTRKIQQGLFGRNLDPRIASDPPLEYRAFAYPAFTSLLLWPLSQIPFPAARVLAVVVLVALTTASVFLWMQALSLRPASFSMAAIVLLVLGSYPVLEGLYAGQLGLLVGFLLAASLLALQRGWPLLAGAIMALTAIKPQMTVLAAVYLLIWSWHKWRERGRFCIGLFSTILFLISAAMLVWPRWMQSWVASMVGYHHDAGPALAGEILHLGTNLRASAALAAIALLLTLALSWSRRSEATDSVEFWLTLSLAWCITAVTLLPSQGFQDQVVLLPGIFLVSYRWRELSSTWTYKAVLVVGAAVMMWPWLAAFGLIASRPLLAAQQGYSRALFALPIRTAAAFPFVLLGALALSLRHPRRSSLRSASPSCDLGSEDQRSKDLTTENG
jgi:hypothetical protein